MLAGYKSMRFFYVTVYYYVLPFAVIIWNYYTVNYTKDTIVYKPGV